MHLNRCSGCSFAALTLKADALHLVVMPLLLIANSEYRGLQKAFCRALHIHAGIEEGMHTQMTFTSCRAASVHL